MTKREQERLARQEGMLRDLGFTADECDALRRISRTLRRWFTLECGSGNDRGSWAIERDDNGDGPPFMVRHHYTHQYRVTCLDDHGVRILATSRRFSSFQDAQNYAATVAGAREPKVESCDTVSRTRIADRERGARRRLAAIVAARNTRESCPICTVQRATCPHASVTVYVQTDPRGAALYLIRPGDVLDGGDVASYYTRGVCVY